MDILNNINIILIETTHSGNIGSVARAMKTMGLSQLCLVSPQQQIDQQAIALAANATDILEQATIVDNFDTAVADCQLVIGTSARLRHLSSHLIEPKSCAEKAIQTANVGKVAIVFGRERFGLTNNELLKCQYHVHIPTNSEYSSLNLAMAVQIICYELRLAWQVWQKSPPISPLVDYPLQQELEYFFQHTESVYRQLGFIRNEAVMLKLRRLFQRSRLENAELNLLRGMLTAVDKMMQDKD